MIRLRQRLKPNQPDSGIIYIATVIMVLVLFGLLAFTLNTVISVNSEKTANLYLDTEAELYAQAGIEYAFYELVNDFINWPGSSGYINFGKGQFKAEVFDTDENGNTLNADRRRVVSTGIVESSVKKAQVYFTALSEPFSFAMYIKQLENPVNNTEIEIGRNNTLTGDLYFGTNVYVKTPESQIDTTTIYVSPGHEVTSDADFSDIYTWQVYPPPLPIFPVFDTTIHDSLLAIAEAVTSSSENEIFGNVSISTEWDLSTYENNTVFINGNLTVSTANAVIGSFTTTDPAYIIVNGTADYKTGCSVGDNVITIASGNVSVISTGTQYGLDWSALPIPERPARVNELFSKTNLDISGGKVFANVESLGDLQLRGTIYASCYCAGTVEIESAIFEGSVVATDTKLDRITNSVLTFILPLPGSVTGGLKPTIEAGSWKTL